MKKIAMLLIGLTLFSCSQGEVTAPETTPLDTTCSVAPEPADTTAAASVATNTNAGTPTAIVAGTTAGTNSK